MIFKLKKIKLIAIGSSIFFYINSCGKEKVFSNPGTHGPGPNLPYGNDDEPGQGAKDGYNTKNIDSKTFLGFDYFPIQEKFSKEEDFDGVIQNAGNGTDKGNLSWAIGGGGLNGACSSFVSAKKYELYEIINHGKIKKTSLDCSKARSLLSEEECAGLDNFVYRKGEYPKLFETKFSCLFKSKHNEQLGCKLITFSNETVTKDGKYFLMLYQVGPQYDLYQVDGIKFFIENLIISNNCFFKVIAKNQGFLEGKTIYFSGVSNGIFASRVNIDLGNGNNTAVENILNAMAVKNFNDLGKDTKIKIVLNKDTAVAYNFIKDKGKEEVLNLLKSATGVDINIDIFEISK